MPWMDRLRKTAGEVAARIGQGVDQAADLVARTAPGSGAAEMVAERDYHRAWALAREGLDEPRARQAAVLLLPHVDTDSVYGALIGNLLGDALVTLNRPTEAEDAYDHALRLLNSAEYRVDAERTIITERNQRCEDLEVEVLVSLARLAFQAEDWDTCIRRAQEALSLENKAVVAYYLQGTAMRRKGLPPELTAEQFRKALQAGADPAWVVQWVREVIPDQEDYFAYLKQRLS